MFYYIYSRYKGKNWKRILTRNRKSFPPLFIRSWGKPLFQEDLEALRDAIKGIEEQTVIDNIDVIYL